MKIRYLFATLFGIIGCAVAVLAIQVSFAFREETPMLLKTPEEAQTCIVQTMESICSGDYAKAEQYIYGNPSFGVDRMPSDPVSARIWEAFLESLRYELGESFFSTKDGLSRTVKITCMDISSVTATLGERSQALLKQWVDEAEDASEVYDENNEYRRELVYSALEQAAEAALAEDAVTKTVELTVQVIYREERWWVVADDTFLSAISGGLTG